MNKEIQYIITNLQETLDGEPWFGRSLYSLFKEVDPTTVFVNPDEKGHALIELLYHMITWAQFVQNSLEGTPEKEVAWFEVNDWREIDPVIHTWKNGVAEFKATNKRIIELLNQKDDTILSSTVRGRKYNVGYMLHGYIQHNIYHIGQIAYAKKLLNGDE
jgi:uncharacterized damage-inducible protein DinB